MERRISKEDLLEAITAVNDRIAANETGITTLRGEVKVEIAQVKTEIANFERPSTGRLGLWESALSSPSMLSSGSFPAERFRSGGPINFVASRS